MVDENAGEIIGKLLASAVTALVAAWAFVMKFFGSRMNAIEEAVSAQSERDAARRESLRDESRRDIQRLEQKVDTNHATIMSHLMDIKGRLP
jgi:hypothetical protein